MHAKAKQSEDVNTTVQQHIKYLYCQTNTFWLMATLTMMKNECHKSGLTIKLIFIRQVFLELGLLLHELIPSEDNMKMNQTSFLF